MKLVKGFVNALDEQYKNRLHYEDIVPSSHGTASIEWELNDYYVSIEIGEHGIGFYSELLDGSNDYNDYNDNIIDLNHKSFDFFFQTA